MIVHLQSIVKSGTYMQTEHVISNSKYTIFRGYLKPNLEDKAIKIISTTHQSTLDKHLSDQLAPYFHFLNQSQPSSQYQIFCKFKEEGKNLSTNYLITPYLRGKSLKFLVQTNSELLNIDHLNTYIDSLLQSALRGGGLPRMLMTASTIFIDELGELQVNYSSTIGFSLLYESKGQAKRAEFLQAYPYLFYSKKAIGQNELDAILKKRAFLVNILMMLTQNDLEFLKQGQNIKNQVYLNIRQNEQQSKEGGNDALNALKQLPQRYQKFLNQPLVKKKIDEASLELQNRRKKLFGQVIDGENMKMNQDKEAAQLWKLFDRVLVKGDNFSWTQIMSFFSKPKNNQFNSQFNQFSNLAWKIERNQRFYEDRGLTDIYLPIKLGANICLSDPRPWHCLLQAPKTKIIPKYIQIVNALSGVCSGLFHVNLSDKELNIVKGVKKRITQFLIESHCSIKIVNGVQIKSYTKNQYKNGIYAVRNALNARETQKKAENFV